MIAALQKKFILVSTLSVVAVFAGIFLLLAVFSQVQAALASNDGVFPPFDPAQAGPGRGLPYDSGIDAETRFSTRFFTVWMDGADRITRVNIDAISSLTEDQVRQYASQAAASGRTMLVRPKCSKEG